MNIYNVIVIGGGCAGLSAGIWLGRADLTNLIFTENSCGMLSTSSIIENFPGYESIDGKKLIKKIRKQAEKYGGKIVDKCITRVDFSTRPFRVYDHDGIEYKTSSVIIATGSIPNRLNLEDEDKLWGKYISSCATCDGPLFKNKKIIVLGGGDSSLEEALILSKFGKVTLIHRKNTFRASVVLQKRVSKNSKIRVITDHTVIKINTGTCKNEEVKLTSITCKNEKTGELVQIDADAMFYALGFKPNSKLFENILELNENGYVVIKKSDHFETSTSIEGIFVTGDVSSDSKKKQAALASASGIRGALDCNNFLHDMHIVEDEHF